ncbi:fatty acid hydroxylase family protein [Roseibium denhamense]|uniref:Sterol desaturase/sphingolipid hydroxylase, fatty acid hydroxylase superfamily n=1 Tax=Roseibium denhamense TaxID=76305 RepID=A0ABY1PGQ4_9HYPH|nr:sterol desaturase family protein [Roseibium denhamense]MTI04698.1 fatty acid hydroxylase family protein [Roseibium denhamense]SMP33746.1 Sterol desaturase/sphingolipid hydroxylase, fatty acid hydroxylase superfamily [Roseibium denhamense]
MTLVLDYLLVLGAIYAAMLAVYFGTGFTLIAINRRHPERRIQKHRDGMKRQREEILASLKALFTSSVLLSGGYFAQTQGWVLFPPVDLSWWSFPLMFAVCFVLFDAWFYWGHRILHLPALYKFHVPHHRSIAPTVWSNDSSTTVDTLIEHSFYFVVWFVLPVPALSVFALRLFDQISGMVGHSGFEYFASKSSRYPSPLICTTFHDLHHSQFHYNYGNFFSFWDRVCGTVHPKYDQLVRSMEETGEVPDTEDTKVKATG